MYPTRLAPGGLDPRWFSARRRPDRQHSTIKQCAGCGLVFADPIPEDEELGRLYGDSEFTYGSDVPHLARTYRRYLARAARHAGSRGRLLEIGCGNGFLLAEAQSLGFASIAGVEPSAQAVAQAPDAIRTHISVGTFNAAHFAPASIDLACAFQVLDHLPDPRGVLQDVRPLLKPGGALLLVQHHVRSWTARLLGERSPIFDIAHPYLYEPATLRRLLDSCGYEVREVFTVWNTYSLRYWLHLFPLPAALGAITDALMASWAGRLPLRLPVGNFGVVSAPRADAGVAR
jgi:SAM-dependent methyltransferase